MTGNIKKILGVALPCKLSLISFVQDMHRPKGVTAHITVDVMSVNMVIQLHLDYSQSQ